MESKMLLVALNIIVFSCVIQSSKQLILIKPLLWGDSYDDDNRYLIAVAMSARRFRIEMLHLWFIGEWPM